MFRYLTFLFLIISLEGCISEKPTYNSNIYPSQVDRSVLQFYFPRQHNYWFSTSGNSPYIKSQCPLVNLYDKYIKIDYKLSDSLIPENIAVLNVFMEKKEDVGGKIQWFPVVDNYYLPGEINEVRIRNHFPVGEYKIWYGFFLKKDSLSQYPTLYKNSCLISIK